MWTGGKVSAHLMSLAHPVDDGEQQIVDLVLSPSQFGVEEPGIRPVVRVYDRVRSYNALSQCIEIWETPFEWLLGAVDGRVVISVSLLPR